MSARTRSLWIACAVAEITQVFCTSKTLDDLYIPGDQVGNLCLCNTSWKLFLAENTGYANTKR